MDAAVTFLPYWWRFCQQLRRYWDSNFKSKRDAVNAGKYFTSLCVVSFSWADHTYSAEYAGHHLTKWDIFGSPYKTGWAISVVICATYKLIWDIKQDWKLGDANAPNWMLRKRLVYPVWFYYYAILQDTLLRFNWVLSISPTYFHLNSVSSMLWLTATGTLECVRRFTWTLLRVEAEHTTNVGKMRAFNEVPLPNLERMRLELVVGDDLDWDHRGDDVDIPMGVSQDWSMDGGSSKISKRGNRYGRRRNGRSNLMRADLMAHTTVTH
jgi:hypothetical protein